MQRDAPAVTCYTADVSICSMICRLAAVEHKVPNCIQRNVDIECAMENYEAWFVTIQPKMTVPCMQYGDDVIGDSKDIMYFLSERHPDAGLYPADQKANIDTFVNLFYSKFGVIARFTFGNWVRKSDKIREFIGRGKKDKSVEKLKTLIEETPLLKGIALGNVIGRLRLRSKLLLMLKLKQHIDFVGFMMKADLEAMDAGMQVVLDVVEASLEKSPFVCGTTYTLADITATAFLARVHIVKGESMFGVKTISYWSRMKARPSFQDAYVIWKWDQTLMSKQVEAFANGIDPETVKWPGPPIVSE